MKRAFPLFFLLGFGLVGGCIEKPELLRGERLSALEEKGRTVFMREPCTSCHVLTIALANVEVPRGFAPNLRKTVARSRDWYRAYFVDSRAVLPWSPMPFFGYLSDDEIDALIAFLHRTKMRPPGRRSRARKFLRFPGTLRRTLRPKAYIKPTASAAMVNWATEGAA